jgi:hypothetical protein
LAGGVHLFDAVGSAQVKGVSIHHQTAFNSIKIEVNCRTNCRRWAGVSLDEYLCVRNTLDIMKWTAFLKDGQRITITADKVTLHNGAARFHTLTRMADSTAAIICAGSWSRITAEGSDITLHPAEHPAPQPFTGGFA